MARFSWAAVVIIAASHCAGVLAADNASSRRWRDPLETPAVISTLASTSQLLSVTVAGGRLVAVGWRGHIVVSDDGGVTWKQVPCPVSVDLTKVFFVSPKIGWAVGQGGVVLHTKNGGLEWQVQVDGRATAKEMLAYYEKQQAAGTKTAAKLVEDVKLNTKTGADQPWLDLHFLNQSKGYVVGSFGMFMGTNDAGRSWTPLLDHIDNPNAFHLTGIAATDGDVFIASEQGIVFHKAPDSDHFKALQTGYAGTFFGIVSQQNVIIAFGLRGNAYRSNDRGTTWSPLKTGVSVAITGGNVLNDGSVLLVTQAGDLLMAPPSSSTFTRVKANKSGLFTGLALTPENRVVITGTGGVFAQPLDRRAP